MEKSQKNIVEEWATIIKRNAEAAYGAYLVESRNKYIQRIIGNCEGILATLDCCEDDRNGAE